LLELPSELDLDWETVDHGYFHEDGFLAVQNRHILQKYGIKYAPLSVAVHFSKERVIPENKGVKSFLFHQWSGENSKYPCFGGKKTFLYKVIRYLKKLWSKYV